MPLPPYLGDVELSDPERYQHAVEAPDRPVAGGAIRPPPHAWDVLIAISDAGAEIVEVELRVGWVPSGR